MPSTNVFKELCVKVALLRSFPKETLIVCNTVYFRLCIDLMHITPPATTEGYDGSHHPRMENIFIPKLLHGSPKEKLFHRLETFIDICENLTLNLRLGKDLSLDVMKSLLEFPPVHGFHAMDSLFYLIKEAVLEYQEAKLNGTTIRSSYTMSGCLSDCVNTTGCIQLGEASSQTQFSSGLKDDFVVHLHRSVLFSISTYKEYLESLRKCQEACHLAKQKSKEIQDQLDKLKDSTNEKRKVHQKVTFWPKKLKSIEELEEKLTNCKVHEAQTEMAFTATLSDVTDYRENQLKYFSEMLKDDIQRQIQHYLLMSLDNLKDLRNHFPMSEQLLTRLENFDCWHTAERIYTSLCTRFHAPIFKDDTLNSVIPPTTFSKPAVLLSGKPDSPPSHSSSSVCIQHELGSEKTHKNDELYVTSRDEISSTQIAQLRLKKDQKVKQKFLSDSGNVAFGWTRRFYGGKKKYGFYLTSNVQVQ